MRGLRVAVLGAGGIVAPAIVRDLAESGEVGQLLLLDIDHARAEATRATHARRPPGAGGDLQTRAAAVDARSPALAAALEGIDVLVNAASYRVNLDAMRACLAAGCHYVDLGGLYRMTGEQLELDARFRDAGLLALLGMGSSPGKTNVMAARAVRALGGAAPAPEGRSARAAGGPLRIDVMAAGRDLDPPPGPSYPYSPRTLVDELTLPPVVLRGGEAVEIEPLTAGGTVDFPPPIGRAETIHTLHSELRTFGDSFGCAEASFRLSLAPATLDRVRALLGADERALEAAARTAAPASSQTVSVHVVEAERDGATAAVTAVTQPMADWGLGGAVVSIAAPAAAAVRLLARGLITARGALPPERCVDPGVLFPELERRGCTFGLEPGAVALLTGSTCKKRYSAEVHPPDRLGP